jgi:hypothetical protein
MQFDGERIDDLQVLESEIEPQSGRDDWKPASSKKDRAM